MPPKDDDKPISFAKNPRSAENRLAYLEKKNRELEESLTAIKAEKKKEREDFSKEDAESHVDVLERDGYVLNRDREVLAFQKWPIGDERRDYAKYIRDTRRTGHGTDIPPGGFLNVEDGRPEGELTKAELDEALRYSKANKCSFAEAQLKFKKRA